MNGVPIGLGVFDRTNVTILIADCKKEEERMGGGEREKKDITRTKYSQ